MEINWILIGWIIDMILNGIVWLIIAAFLIPVIEVTDKWTRKSISLMDKVDKWIRKVFENLFEWIQSNNLNILFAFLLIIIFFLVKAAALKLFKTISLLKFSDGPCTVDGLKITAQNLLSAKFNISFSALNFDFAYSVIGLIFLSFSLIVLFLYFSIHNC